MSYSLTSLWEHMNQFHDYPVVVFHQGLPPHAKREILTASMHRLWFARIATLATGPADDHERLHPESSSLRRWRTGPVFREGALADFDYALMLEPTAYLPGTVSSDPFQVLDSHGVVAAFPHHRAGGLAEQADSTDNLFQHFLLYCSLKNIHPRRSRLLSYLISEDLSWSRQSLKFGFEFVRLEWFRGDVYQDFFQYLDSTGGFSRHRWEHAAVRSLALGSLLEDGQVRALSMPYADAHSCVCLGGETTCVLSPETGRFQCPADGIASIDLLDPVSAFLSASGEISRS
eukprot:TRINITY_DN36120_c0_g1_i2.p1 TRINITY_DN36120_c0_g1~~TRINITY_DN36120_c0_g1_i2.p1  ORF type:complete len:288 (+),score=3.61 TRINITY_DN36120_c0_g1_i2:333-1196(+)